MTIDMQTVISNMRALKSKGVTYSMSGSRTGADGTADCSGAVYSSLNTAGANLSLGNTDSLFTDLPSLGFSKTDPPYAYGDIFIFGIQGQSSGAAGHTGIFLDANQIIHCNYGDNGVGIGDFNTVRSYDGNPPFTVFRLAGQQPTPTEDATSETNTKENMDNSGEIEEYSYIGDKLCIKGWHFSSIPTKSNSGDDNSGGGGSSGSGGTVDWNDVQSRAQFFMNVCHDLGIPLNTALALAANAYVESSLEPSALEPMEASGAQGKGYFQWSYAYNWGDVPNHMSRSYEDAKYQINFAKSNSGQWISVGYGSWDNFWKGTDSPEVLTNAWVASWERPANIGNRWATFTSVVNVDALTYGDKSISVTRARASSVTTGKELLEIYDATNDKKLKTVEVELKSRKDIAKDNPDVDGIEWSGIDLCITFESTNPFYIQFVRVRSDGVSKILNVQQLFFPHSSSRSNIGRDYSKDDEFLIACTDKNGKNQFVRKIIGGLSWSIEGNEVPSCTFTIPIYEAEKFDGHMDCKVIIFKKVFDGIVKMITLNKDEETATIELDHKISEWDYRQIPNNYTVKNETFPSVFCQSPFLYSTDWYVNNDAQAQKEKINYAFSRQGHLEALTKAVSLTDKLWWRVGTRYDRFLEIGSFGEKKKYILSETGQTDRHIKIIGNVSISKQFDNIFNVATVYGEKSDSSQVSLTLRECYLDQQQQGHDIIAGFPIVILNPTANREQKNFYTNITKIASNNSLEYAILDEFSINLEQGKLIEKTISMNDVAPFEEDGKTISDEERAKQSRVAYNAAVKQLKAARRYDEITVQIGELPSDLNVLDRIYFDYHNSIELFDKCSRYCKKIYEASDDFYITKIDTTFDNNLVETNTLTLSKELHRNDSNY
ncbi:phage tail tip lysozyme [Lactococcus lactis]|uniref:Phage tail tip lysozyme n=1 Tax=Lactococcus lactis TaxID=1358 RepID=A0AAP4DTY0_9LACT|nr:phage tail tip lysozyme [Lactococcus lactis]MDG4968245.1 phage tail tip lysozyme [Lactococcus lactis]MDG4976395.1 phage tail tip lysozyme [Lactococcus lactis]MDG5102199.1 phage tail tip lysozyme [Lactococcus lactis]